MIKRSFGSTGLMVSALGLGCNNFGGRLDLGKTRTVVDSAIEAGINFFDTADVYGDRGGSETLLGVTLGNRRKDLILATKFGLPMDDEGYLAGGSRRYVLSAVEGSLKRLKTEWIDIYYLHRPDPATPIEETLGALDELVRQGKIRFAGCSNLPAPQLADAMEVARTKKIALFVAAQDEYNLLTRGIETSLVPVIERFGLALVPYFPLASGLLTGRYRTDADRYTTIRPPFFGAVRERAELRGGRAARNVLCGARPDDVGTRLWLAAGATVCGERDRRRHCAGASGPERRRARLAVDGGRGHAGRSDHR
jgi:aryl-alcohol dehydrogenase-like predicted oxidoreductase